MEKLIHILFCAAMLLSVSQTASAHEAEKHEKKELREVESDTIAQSADTLVANEQSEPMHPPVVDATWKDFPSVHPLIVHFPIVFLLLAFFAQLAAIFFWKRELSLITLILLVAGFLGAYVAGNLFHPHTNELNELARQVLEKHERYADLALWLSGIGSLLKIVSHFFLNRKIWAEAAVVLLLIGAAWSVSIAGHYGATLVHLHGVGPQGAHLEMSGHKH